MDYIPLNCSLDDLFGSGVLTRTITQIYGPPASGKSNICIVAACNAAMAGKKVVFIDPEGSFSPQRIKQIAGESYEKVMDNIFLLEPSSFEEQAKVIARLQDNINEDVALVIVDSMVYHWRILDKEDGTANKELALQMTQLLDIARKKNVAVLVTNQVYTNPESGTVEPAAGDVMKYSSKIIIALDNKFDRTAKLVRHLYKKEGSFKKFEIIDSGLV